MASPFLPQVLVFKDFQQPSTATPQPLRTCVVGPHAQLVRHGVAAERRLGSLGDLESLTTSAFHPWPSLAPGGLVDRDFVKLFVDGAKLSFFHKPIGGGKTLSLSGTPKNRVKISGVEGFAQNGAHPRLPGLRGRDVVPGDRARLSADVAGVPVHHDTYVLAVDGDVVPAAVGAADPAATNAPTKSAAAVTSQIGGDVNCVELVGDATDYDGAADGATSEVYTFTVIEGSTGEDPTTAKLRVRSASGLDDVDEFTPAAEGTPKAVGARGLKVTVNHDTTTCDLMVGQVFQIAVDQDFVKTAATAGGTYAGDVDDTYIVTITRGGDLAEVDPAKKPQWAVTTARGLDQSGPRDIPAAGVAGPIGSLGVTLALDGGTTTVRKGDRFAIPVTAAAVGNLNTLVLADGVPSPLAEEADFSLRLYRVADVRIPETRHPDDPGLNYELDPVDANAGIRIGDQGPLSLSSDEFLDEAGERLPLTVIGGEVVVEYRAWIPDLSGELRSVNRISDLPGAVSGDVDPANPLSWAISKALIGANGTDVLFVSVADPDDLASWAAALDKLVGREDVYAIVPLTRNPAVVDLFAAHVGEQSTAEEAMERKLFVGIEPRLESQIVGPATSADGEIVLATIEADPGSASGAVTLLTDHGGNARFLSAGVRPGDVVRYGYATAFGQQTHETRVVARVTSETTLLLRSGADAPVVHPSRVEIWRNHDHEEIVADLKAQAAARSNARVVYVWSDLFGLAAPRTESWNVAAALAGLTSGILPHQSLTHVAVEGFEDVASRVGELSTRRVADLCGNGVLVVSRNANVADNAIICRLGTTTDVSSLATREEMIGRNVDSMVKFVRARLYDLLGASNVTPAAAALLRVEMEAAHSLLAASGFTQRLGAQLIAADLHDVRQHAVFRDRFVVEATWTVPAPTNTIELHANIVI